MSKTERLSKENPDLNINLTKLIKLFDPSDSGKFMQFLISQFKTQVSSMMFKPDDEAVEIIGTLADQESEIEKYAMYMMYHTIGKDKLYALWEFYKHLEENRIENKDIQSYKKWDDIIHAVHLAELKVKEKEYRKQIIELYSDQEWVVLKPLTFESSLAYGSATKWCTAMKHNPNYFYQYSERGCLIYVINRKDNNKKFGVFIELQKKFDRNRLDISFWTPEDAKVESLALGIPDYIMDVLRTQINDKTQLKPNKYFFEKSELKRMDEFSPKKTGEIMEAAQPVGDYVQYDEAPGEAPNMDAEGVHVHVMEEAEGEIEMLAPREARIIQLQGRAGRVTHEVVDNIPHDEDAMDVEEVGEEIPQNAENLQRNEIEGILNEALDDEDDSDPTVDYKTPIKKGDSIPHIEVLAPGLPEFPIHGNEFEPAPWLTQLEINDVNKKLEEFRWTKQRSGHRTLVRVYPNGKIDVCYDKKRGDIVYHREIFERRPGRNENERINPFGINEKPNMQTDDMPMIRMEGRIMAVNPVDVEGENVFL